MAAHVQFRLGRAGKILVLPGVADLLETRARRVAAAVDAHLSRLEGPYPPVTVRVDRSGRRARATIVGVPLELERSRRILGGAIDAAS